MTDHLPVMVIAVVVAVLVMLLAANPLANFIRDHPTVVMLALGFLLMIGLVLVVIVLVGRQRLHRWMLYVPNLVIRQIAGRKAVVAVPESDA